MLLKNRVPFGNLLLASFLRSWKHLLCPA